MRKRNPGEAAAKPGLLGLGNCVEGDSSTPLSYYNHTATLWGYRGQPLESLRGVILMPLSTVCEASFTAIQ